MRQSASRILLMFGRALRLRCPNCGGGPLLESWLRPRSRCPSCGLPLERGEEGYQVGSYMFNIIASELLFAAVFIGLIWLTWPAVPWTALQIGGVIMMVIAPFAFFPFSKTLFLAFDLVFRPVTKEELR
jgi:uncharacterized protein (DUF983 family)